VVADDQVRRNRRALDVGDDDSTAIGASAVVTADDYADSEVDEELDQWGTWRRTSETDQLIWAQQQFANNKRWQDLALSCNVRPQDCRHGSFDMDDYAHMTQYKLDNQAIHQASTSIDIKLASVDIDSARLVIGKLGQFKVHNPSAFVNCLSHKIHDKLVHHGLHPARKSRATT